MPTQNSTTFPHLNKRICNLNGWRFTRLIVIGFVDISPRRQSLWLCKCDCGQFVTVVGAKLINNCTHSCGCFRRDQIISANTTHGFRSHPALQNTYRRYYDAKRRCESPKSQSYADYGGRGIKFCFQSFNELLEDIGICPKGLTLDRIDNNGHYEKGNVQWVDYKQQSRNKRSNHFVSAQGHTRLIVEWSEITGLSQDVISGRLRKYHWCDECAVTIPLNGGTCTHKFTNPHATALFP